MERFFYPDATDSDTVALAGSATKISSNRGTGYAQPLMLGAGYQGITKAANGATNPGGTVQHYKSSYSPTWRMMFPDLPPTGYISRIMNFNVATLWTSDDSGAAGMIRPQLNGTNIDVAKSMNNWTESRRQDWNPEYVVNAQAGDPCQFGILLLGTVAMGKFWTCQVIEFRVVLELRYTPFPTP